VKFDIGTKLDEKGPAAISNCPSLCEPRLHPTVFAGASQILLRQQLSQLTKTGRRYLADADTQRDRGRSTRRFSPAPAASPAEGGKGENSDRAPCQASSARAALAALFGHAGYFLFIGGSSMNAPQYPVGLTFDAFFTTLIFILLS
jgi:hypothetical protein